MKKKLNFGKTFKQLFFTYLLVNKVMYWMDVFNGLDGFGEFGMMFLSRMVNQDIMVILVLIAMHVLEEKLHPNDSLGNDFKKNALFMVLGWLIFLAMLSGYLLFVGLFVEVTIDSWPRLLLDFTIGYLIIGAVIYVKDSMKKKEAESYLTDGDSHEAQRYMLESLHKNGVLTQEEFEQKLAQIMPNLKEKAK